MEEEEQEEKKKNYYNLSWKHAIKEKKKWALSLLCLCRHFQPFVDIVANNASGPLKKNCAFHLLASYDEKKQKNKTRSSPEKKVKL